MPLCCVHSPSLCMCVYAENGGVFVCRACGELVEFVLARPVRWLPSSSATSSSSSSSSLVYAVSEMVFLVLLVGWMVSMKRVFQKKHRKASAVLIHIIANVWLM